MRFRKMFTLMAVPIVSALLHDNAIAQCPWSYPPVVKTWDGGGADKNYTTDENWDDDVEPDCGYSTCFVEGDGHDECIYDKLDDKVENIYLAGNAPTSFTFTTSAQKCCAGILVLDDYGRLNIGECFEVQGYTQLWARAKAQVASGETCCFDELDVTEANTALDLTGTAYTSQLGLDVVGYGHSLSFAKKGTGTLLANDIRIRGEYDTNDPAALSGLSLEEGTITTVELHVRGGPTTTRRAYLDLDESMTVRNTTDFAPFNVDDPSVGQVIVVNVAADKTFDTGRLYIAGGTELTVTGSGIGQAPGKLQSSDSESASDYSCTCSCDACP